MAELRYKHYLLTRFNVNVVAGMSKQFEKINVAADEKYLTERFRLFFKYTVPSIKNQTTKNFEWLVFFSDRTPYQFRQKIYDLEKELSVFKPIFISYDTTIHNVSYDAIIHNVTAEYIKQEQIDFYITSRLDNDDALAADYIEKVQRYFLDNNITNKRVLVLNDGYQLDEGKRYLVKYYYPHNHFTSMLQPFDGQKIDNICRYPHLHIEEYVKTVSVDTDKPMWLEVVHGTNVCNRMQVNAKNFVGDKNALNIFGVDVEVKTKRSFIYIITLRPKNAVKIIRQYGIKSILYKIKKRILRK